MAKKLPKQVRSNKKSEEFVFTPEIKKYLIIAAAVIVALILFFVIKNNMRFLKLDADGNVVMPEGQYWLMNNEGNTDKPRYVKMAELTPAEGYTQKSRDFMSDKNEFYYTFDNGSELTYLVTLGSGSASETVETAMRGVPSLMEDPIISEKQTETIAGKEVIWFTLSGGNQKMDNTGVDYYSKRMFGYVPLNDKHCVVISVEQRSDLKAAQYKSDDEFKAVLEQAVAGVSL